MKTTATVKIVIPGLGEWEIVPDEILLARSANTADDDEGMQ